MSLKDVKIDAIEIVKDVLNSIEDKIDTIEIIENVLNSIECCDTIESFRFDLIECFNEVDYCVMRLNTTL